ncbi:D-alanyl-D-alanine carboxypeptidase/D-alanyl-D-alanine endopeptidase [Calothrix sp. 336/3]|uniref:D-alanyl-D-alanine carboxypeptidase/D-alanyl-D-alanine endopeptidase n=1 Tax=Calothrix sp. 336/3 TaxID=1337936 RepID=UPI0004E2FD80|nr:D-alanyl-D-alanine carboxypeptidase/D-alanyl-D-alanine-endopeptidase [Calothrix sp. 336/3]AKG24255.1 D-alanyl-D-alanine carboxypeptidase [Calothrix sp. 336/3]
MRFRKITTSLLLLFISTPLGLTSEIAQAQVVVPTETPPSPTTPVAPANTTSFCPAQLTSAIDAVVNRTQFTRARWGILIQPLGSNQTLYNRDSKKFFTPASVTKVLTTAAALQALGSSYRFRTTVYGNAENMRVVGGGDPSLTNAQLQALAKQLKQRGIQSIKTLNADEGLIQGDIVHPTWQWEDIYSDYGAPISSFMVNENTFGIKLSPQAVGRNVAIAWNDANEARLWQVINQSTTVANNQPNTINITRELSGRVLRIQGNLAANADPMNVALPVVDPGFYFLRRFRTALAGEKISLDKTALVTGGKNESQLASVQSPPLSELIATVNLDSNNLYAESLLRALGTRQARKPQQTTADAGLELLKTTLTQLGVDATSYIINDGSGLSRRNLISPEALVQTLRGIARSPGNSVYRASLPVGGKTGTLKFRFRNTPAEGIVQAKTGTMTGVVSLAGYVNPPNYEPIVFSVIVNQTSLPASTVRQAIDEVVIMLAQLRRC